jgi:hypothetical protein
MTAPVKLDAECSICLPGVLRCRHAFHSCRATVLLSEQQAAETDRSVFCSVPFVRLQVDLGSRFVEDGKMPMRFDPVSR